MIINLGDRVRLISMPNDPCPIEAGETGTVDWIGDRFEGHRQIGVRWDSGRKLMMLEGLDQWEIIPDEPFECMNCGVMRMRDGVNGWVSCRDELGIRCYQREPLAHPRKVGPIKVDDVAGVETGRCTNCDRPSDDYDTTCQGCGSRLIA